MFVGAEEPARPKPSSLPRDVRSWFIAVACAALTYLIVGSGVFSAGAEWQVPLFVGAVTAMVASSGLQAGIVAVSTFAATRLLIVSSQPGTPQDAAAWILSLVLVTVASFGVGFVRTRFRKHDGPFALAVSTVLVSWLLVSLWAPLFAGGVPLTRYGSLSASTIRDVPVAGNYVNDDAIYRRVFYLMHSGMPYYQAFRDGWLGMRNAPPLPLPVTAYRLPTMYWLWSLLPADAFLIVVVFLAFVSVGAIAAAFITGQLIGTRFAPLAAAALVAYAMGSAMTVYVTYVDLPAACVALVGIALFAKAEITDDDRFLWSAAAVLALAALTREILAYLVVLAALSATLQPAARRLRKVAPWLTALGVFAIGYAAHVLAVQRLISHRSHALSYLGGSPAFALDAVRRFSNVMTGGGALLPALFILGILGAWAASKRAGWAFAVFAMVAIAVPVVAMIKLGNPGIDAAGGQVNYWGNLVVPLALALWPVSAQHLSDERDEP